MNTTLALLAAQLLSLIAFGTFAVWYAVPWLRLQNRSDGLGVLVWFHVFRSLALQLYSAQQNGLAISDLARDRNVVGDCIGVGLALLALGSLRYRARFAVPLVWVLVAETALDIGSGILGGVQEGTLGRLSGVTWLVLAYYVPLIVVCLVLTVWQLLAPRTESHAKKREESPA